MNTFQSLDVQRDIINLHMVKIGTLPHNILRSIETDYHLNVAETKARLSTSSTSHRQTMCIQLMDAHRQLISVYDPKFVKYFTRLCDSSEPIRVNIIDIEMHKNSRHTIHEMVKYICDNYAQLTVDDYDWFESRKLYYEDPIPERVFEINECISHHIMNYIMDKTYANYGRYVEILEYLMKKSVGFNIMRDTFVQLLNKFILYGHANLCHLLFKQFLYKFHDINEFRYDTVLLSSSEEMREVFYHFKYIYNLDTIRTIIKSGYMRHLMIIADRIPQHIKDQITINDLAKCNVNREFVEYYLAHFNPDMEQSLRNKWFMCIAKSELDTTSGEYLPSIRGLLFWMVKNGVNSNYLDDENNNILSVIIPSLFPNINSDINHIISTLQFMVDELNVSIHHVSSIGVSYYDYLCSQLDNTADTSIWNSSLKQKYGDRM